MFPTQEDLESALLHYIVEFNKTQLATPGVVVYKGHQETETGVLLETFPFAS